LKPLISSGLDEDHPGLRLTNTKQTYYEAPCTCGNVTRKEPYRSNSQDVLSDITCSQWRVVGPGLAALIVCLAYRMRLSRERIQEFLQDLPFQSFRLLRGLNYVRQAKLGVSCRVLKSHFF